MDLEILKCIPWGATTDEEEGIEIVYLILG